MNQKSNEFAWAATLFGADVYDVYFLSRLARNYKIEN